MFRIIFFLFTCVIVCGCGSGEPTTTPVEKEKTAAREKTSIPEVFDNDVERFPNNEGPIGIFPVGEMLVLSIMDSAVMQDVAMRTTRNYTLIEADMNKIGAEADGPLGQISYNNDPENFKFECLIPIKKMPQTQPDHSRIVVLEATRMLIYNHYGPYQQLYRSYDKIREFCRSKGLTQSGPVREFYITDPTVETDQSKWITRIMLPVIDKK
jgi:effector-binding domain-containing protein